MIKSSGMFPLSDFVREELDVLVYGLGYEVRSTVLASKYTGFTLAIRMQGPAIHASERNQSFARTSKHIVLHEDLIDLKKAILAKIERSETLRIGFDISSVNRAVLFDLLSFLAASVRETDSLICYYVSAKFQEPDSRFPQIESFGPSSSVFSGFQSDPTLPLCLILGAGYEAGVSMGMISQLEPRISYCFWGSGNDGRFDRLVKRANVDFKYPGFDVKALEYPLQDARSAFGILESLTYGILKNYRVVIAPMGPKIFSLLAALVAMEHFGMVAVWRVKHSHMTPSAAVPAGRYLRVAIDTDMLRRFAAAQDNLFEAA